MLVNFDLGMSPKKLEVPQIFKIRIFIITVLSIVVKKLQPLKIAISEYLLK